MEAYPQRAIASVPNAFYDLIARVVPGVTVIASFYVALVGPGEAARDLRSFLSSKHLGASSLLVAAILLTLASYLVAMFLSGVSHCVKLKERLSTTTNAKTDRAEAYDTIRYHAPHLAAALAKVRAECSCCERLLIGWTILGIALPFLLRGCPPARVAWTEAAVALLVVVFVYQYRRLDSHLLRGLVNNHRLVTTGCATGVGLGGETG
jgi:hypothetical protein